MSERRLGALLRYLAGASRRGEATLQLRFGERGIELLNGLRKEGRAEHSTGVQRFWWLSAAGRSFARPYLNKKAKAA